MLELGSVFIFHEVITDGVYYRMPLLLSEIFVFTVAYILFRLAAFGSGDAKGLIVLSIIFPSYPVFYFIRMPHSLLRGWKTSPTTVVK